MIGCLFTTLTIIISALVGLFLLYALVAIVVNVGTGIWYLFDKITSPKVEQLKEGGSVHWDR